MTNEYAWWNPSKKQVCLLGNELMTNNKSAIEIPQLADSSWNLSPLKLLCDGRISHRSTPRDFINQSLRDYADEGILSAAQKFVFILKCSRIPMSRLRYSCNLFLSESSIIRLKLSMPLLQRSPVRLKNFNSKFSCGVSIGLTLANHSSKLLLLMLYILTNAASASGRALLGP